MNNQVVYCESPGDDVNLIEDEFISQNSDNKVDNNNDVFEEGKVRN